MFVVKDGYDFIVLAKRVRDFCEEAATGVKMLLLFVPRVFPVFTDTDHAVNGNLVSTDGDRFFDRIKNGDLVFLRQPAGKVPVRELVDVHRRQRQRGTHAPILLPAFQDFTDQDIGMQAFFISGQNRRDRLWLDCFRGGGGKRMRDAGHSRRRGNTRQPVSSRETFVVVQCKFLHFI